MTGYGSASKSRNGRQRLHALLDVADVEDPAVLGDQAGAEQVVLAEAEGERGPAQGRAHLHAAGPGVRRRLVVEGDLAPFGRRDGVAVESLAEVDVGLGEQRAGATLVGVQVVGAAVAADLAGGRERHAVAVRVGEVLALPGGDRDVGPVQLPDREHDLLLLAVDHVAVDVEVAEDVEAGQLLLPLERRGDDVRVDEAGVGDGRLVRLHARVAQRADRVVLAGHVREVERLAREVDVPRDVRALAAGLGWLHLEPLHEGRVGGAGDDGDEHPQADRDDGQPPPPLPHVDDEEHRGEQRDDGQQLERGELGLDVGVGRALDRPPGRRGELVAGQPVPDRLQQGQHGQEHRDVQLDLGADPAVLDLEADPAVQVVRHRGDDEDDDEGREQPVDDERQEGQAEDVEADVLAELRVLHSEADRVVEEQPLLPLAGRRSAGDEAQQQGDADPDQPDPAAHDLPVALDDGLVHALRHRGRVDPVSEGQVQRRQQREPEREDEPQPDLRPQHPGEDAALAERVEPEVVRVEARDAPRREEEDQQHDDEDDEDDAGLVRHALPPPLGRPAGRQVGGDPHEAAGYPGSVTRRHRHPR